jgi:hypothetical protein
MKMDTAHPAAVIAQQFASRVLELLGLTRKELQRIRELLEGADRWNFLGAGTNQGGTTVGTTPVTIVEANPKRTGFTISNIGTAGNISLGIGNRYPQAGTGITLQPSASWDGRLSGKVCQQSITVVGSQAGCTYSWVESM